MPFIGGESCALKDGVNAMLSASKMSSVCWPDLSDNPDSSQDWFSKEAMYLDRLLRRDEKILRWDVK